MPMLLVIKSKNTPPVTQSADDYSVKIAEATNKAFDAIRQLGEKSREAIIRMNDEADFYKDILGRDKLVNEKTGAFTANGVASISLSYEKMTNNIVDNQNIQREIEAVQKRYNNGNNSDYGIEQYNEDMDNLLSQQREAIKNYYDEREAVMSLISDGLWTKQKKQWIVLLIYVIIRTMLKKRQKIFLHLRNSLPLFKEMIVRKDVQQRNPFRNS